MSRATVLVLKSGLFEANEVLEQALASLGTAVEVVRIDLRGDQHSEAHWDSVVDAVLDAGNIITT